MRQTARPLADDRPHSLVPVEESTGAGPVLETDVSGCPQPVDGMQRTWQDLLKRVEIGRGHRDQPGHDPQERTLALRRAQQLEEPHRRIPHQADSRDKLSSTHLGGAHLAKMCPGLWRGRLQVHGMSPVALDPANHHPHVVAIRDHPLDSGDAQQRHRRGERMSCRELVHTTDQLSSGAHPEVCGEHPDLLIAEDELAITDHGQAQASDGRGRTKS